MSPDSRMGAVQEKSPAMLDFLGMIVTAVDRASDIRSGVDMVEGLIVMVAGWGGVAATAGVETGDIIAGMDRKPTSTLKDIEECLAAHQAGTPIVFLLRRAGEWRYVAIPCEESFSGVVHRIQSCSCSISQIKSLTL
jgi:S1-C subfamily serine protease